MGEKTPLVESGAEAEGIPASRLQKTGLGSGERDNWLELKISKAGRLTGATLPENTQHTILFITEGPR